MRLMCCAIPLVALLLSACGGNPSGTSISATATTTAQSLTVGTAMTSFTPLAPSGGVPPYLYSYAGTLPAGLSFSTSTGAVTGTPTATYATANIVFSVQDANAVVANTTSTVSFTVGAASPAITATATTTAQSLTVGTAMASFSPLTPSGGAAPYAYSITTGTLPAGLSLDATTGAVTGTPTAASAAANVVFSVQDANAVVASTTSTVSFTVVAASPSISAIATTTAQSLTVGTAMASLSPLTPSGGATPYLYSYAGTLPAGLSFSTSTGVVAGTPTAPYATANVVFSVQDANAVVANTTSSVSFTVVAATPAITATANTTAQSLTVGTTMTSFSPLTASGGATPYTYSVTSGALPAGLNLNTTTGAVTGAPTAVSAAANVVFSVKDANNVVASTTSTVSFTVVAASPSISAIATTTAQSLTVGTAMASLSPLTPSGGATPYFYSYAGTLPAGLSFSTSTGVVAGTPTAPYATANVVFSVQDANAVVANTTSSVSFTVVAATPAITATANTTAQSLSVGTTMISFSPLTASGGATPYTYSVTTGTLPAGVSLNATTGAVTGAPTAVYAAANVVFSVKDANNVVASTTSTVSFTVASNILAISLPQTGQTPTLPIAATAGMDGFTYTGVPWAYAASGPTTPPVRFTLSPDGCEVTDNLTGLTWLKDTTLVSASTWDAALTTANTGTWCSQTAGAWRLPNVNELASLVNQGATNAAAWLNGQGFTGVQATSYWSSTTHAAFAGAAWYVMMTGGDVRGGNKTYSYYLLPVRGTTAQPSQLPQTGQTTSVAAGDDGALQNGAVGTNAAGRFVVGQGIESACIVDQQTGLMWVRAPSSTSYSWSNAIAYDSTVGGAIPSDYCGHNDWRLPNSNELRSLVNYGQANSASWLNTQGFSNVQSGGYWSSTTYAASTGSALGVNMLSGFSVGSSSKTSSYWVWPVRGGR